MTKIAWVFLSSMEPHLMLLDIKLSFGFEITLTTLKLIILMSYNFVDFDLSFVGRSIITKLTLLHVVSAT